MTPRELIGDVRVVGSDTPLIGCSRGPVRRLAMFAIDRSSAMGLLATSAIDRSGMVRCLATLNVDTMLLVRLRARMRKRLSHSRGRGDEPRESEGVCGADHCDSSLTSVISDQSDAPELNVSNRRKPWSLAA